LDTALVQRQRAALNDHRCRRPGCAWPGRGPRTGGLAAQDSGGVGIAIAVEAIAQHRLARVLLSAMIILAMLTRSFSSTTSGIRYSSVVPAGLLLALAMQNLCRLRRSGATDRRESIGTHQLHKERSAHGDRQHTGHHFHHHAVD
jgi:hypothetical protein